MAQESFPIIPHFLKHLREKSGLTIEAVAAAVDAEADFELSTRQYQRIEKHGKTSKKTAIALAKAFGTSVDELQGRLSIDKSPWYVKSRDELYGKLTIGYHEVITEVFRKVNIGGGALNNNGCVLLDINDKQLPISLKVTHHPHSYESYTSEWIIRPAIINESGILWTSLNKWQQLDWKQQINKLAYNFSNKVIINDEPLVPESSNVGFFVRFEYLVENEEQEEEDKEEKHITNGEWVIEGTQFFQNDADFRCSLMVWLEDNRRLYPFPVHPPMCSPGVLGIYYGCSNKRLVITRAWLDESGQAHQAPWPELQREQLADALESFLKKTSPLPIAIGDLGPEHFPPLAPD
ncbi:helix-turn-helix domain-containing protein [Zobellella maritima]|uniref:helix-turn-helix domain-containing protein n=1 Tax=Zobellella maritima TaxID=2059725 RepID=UPI00130072C5|nr:helix-turn-helix transcriptional regulator [Zobellella maritima]